MGSTGRSKMFEFFQILTNYFDGIGREIEEDLLSTQQQTQAYETIPHLIDRVIVEIKSKNETIIKMEQDMKQLMAENARNSELRSELQISEKKNNDKSQQINILRETVKSLYEEKARVDNELESTRRELATTKESLGSLKKKNKKLEEELKKAGQMVKERLDQYMRADQEMQRKKNSQFLSVDEKKALQAEVERLRADLSKKEKNLTSTNKKVEELKEYQHGYTQQLELVIIHNHNSTDKLTHEIKMLTSELQKLTDKSASEKRRILEENESLIKEIEKHNQKLNRLSQESRENKATINELTSKCAKYQQDIMLRTDKLKEKNKQSKLLTEEITKTNTKVQELNRVAEQLMTENETLRQNVQSLETRNEQYRLFYNQFGKIKGQLNAKKFSEFQKLAEGLENLGRFNNY